MKRILSVGLPLLAAFLLTGCGDRVQVPPAHVGKVLDSSGYTKDLKQPSTFRLPAAMLGASPKLVVVELSEEQVKESFTIFMPLDDLNLTVDIRGTMSISDNPEQVNWLFEKVAPEDRNGVFVIDFDKVYAVYGQNVVRTVARDIVTKYKIVEVLKNREAISQEIFTEVAKQLTKLPIRPRTIALAEVTPPDVVVKAQESKRQREIELERSEADKNIRLKAAEADLEVARQRQAAQLVEAETQVLIDQKLASSVSPAFVTQRALEVMEKIAASDNRVFIMPYEALQNPAMMIGLNAEALRGLSSSSTNSAAVKAANATARVNPAPVKPEGAK